MSLLYLKKDEKNIRNAMLDKINFFFFFDNFILVRDFAGEVLNKRIIMKGKSTWRVNGYAVDRVITRWEREMQGAEAVEINGRISRVISIWIIKEICKINGIVCVYERNILNKRGMLGRKIERKTPVITRQTRYL